MAFNESEVVNDELQGWIGNNNSSSSRSSSKDNNRSLLIMNSQDKPYPPQLQSRQQQQPELFKKMIQQQVSPSSQRCSAHAHPKSSISKSHSPPLIHVLPMTSYPTLVLKIHCVSIPIQSRREYIHLFHLLQ